VDRKVNVAPENLQRLAHAVAGNASADRKQLGSEIEDLLAERLLAWITIVGHALLHRSMAVVRTTLKH